MIGRIANIKEVEQGIREAAEARANRLYPQPTMNELHVLESWAIEDVTRVVNADARPRGVLASLSALDRVGLLWLHVAAFADQIRARCEDEEEKRIATLAAAVLCRHCAHPFLHPNHGYYGGDTSTVTAFAIIQADDAMARGDEDHPFVCPHGDELLTPEDCITDHPDAHSANH